MKYHTRRGIVLTTVGEQKVLVSAVSLHDRVPYVTDINDTTAFCWELLSSGCTEEELIRSVLEEYDEVGPETVRRDISLLVQQLAEQGYLAAE